MDITVCCLALYWGDDSTITVTPFFFSLVLCQDLLLVDEVAEGSLPILLLLFYNIQSLHTRASANIYTLLCALWVKIKCSGSIGKRIILMLVYLELFRLSRDTDIFLWAMAGLGWAAYWTSCRPASHFIAAPR